VIEHLGLDYFSMAFLPLTHERLDDYFVWERWPRDWLNRYLNLNYFHADPVANHVRQSGSPVHWSSGSVANFCKVYRKGYRWTHLCGGRSELLKYRLAT